MLSEEQAEMIVERLVNRIEQANTYFLMQIGDKVKQISKLTPSQAQQLVQMLKYGQTYDDIIYQLSKYTNLNIQDINKIFDEYAKKDLLFAKNFYEYRNIPFEESFALTSQKNVLKRVAMNEMYNFTRSNVLGYTIKDINGIPQFYGLRETYNRVLDEALLNVGQGKISFDSAMSGILKDIGGSGLKTIEYVSGKEMRLDSVVRMHLKSRLRELHNETQKIIGEEIGANGVEISVHLNSAPDHEDVQGKQFTNKQFDNFQHGVTAIDYNGTTYYPDVNKRDRRPISEMNCYHYIFSIVLGVSKPQYSESQLKEIINNNNKGFELDGQHYTNYEGTQLQRGLERKIREQKDIQILAKASNNKELIAESQSKITQLTNKYKQLSDLSGLPTKMNRMKVTGYRRTKTK